MYEGFDRRLRQLDDARQLALLRQGLTGLEKESLRVTSDGTIAQTPHPVALGAALTHAAITTDYSEALLELITEPAADPAQVLAELDGINRFVYANIGEELLWATSMPCVLEGESHIPIARYGDSNAGRLKHIYRRGLGHRYGKTMQVIAGVHFNHSFNEELWPVLADLDGDARPRQQFVDQRYMDVTRNLLRLGWVVPYLFGASPAVCKSFFGKAGSRLSSFNQSTCYEPFATSLRLSDIGYQNNPGGESEIRINYDSLPEYIASLRAVIGQPHPDYARIGVKVGGEYRQLNANRLQIENEYYSSVRVKQPTGRAEKPTAALAERGVRYLELRSLDVSPFEPLGVSDEQLHFLQLFLVLCLLQDSPPMSDDERREISDNLQRAAMRGRDPALQLQRGGAPLALARWGEELMARLSELAAALDRGLARPVYAPALAAQAEKFAEPEATPSARVMREIREHDDTFFHFAMRWSLTHRDAFLRRGLDPAEGAAFAAAARESIERQRELERGDDVDFDTFLARYLAA